MQKYKSIEKTKHETCAALGFFDGLHLGHMAVISQMIKIANEKNFVPTIFTFNESPKLLTLKEATVQYLIPQEEKEKILFESGIDILYSVSFALVMNLSPEDFIEEVLVKALNAKHIFCGFNYHFGKGGNCDVEKLQKLCKPYGITVHVISPVICDGEPISSTRIKDLIKAGNVNLANKMLGRTFSYKFPVIHGLGFGKKILIPTINQYFPENFVIPRFGAYASFTVIDDKKYWSVTNIGTGPTVCENRKPHSETFILDYFGDDLYNKDVEIKLCEFLRDEQKFSTIEELRRHINLDKKRAKSILKVT